MRHGCKGESESSSAPKHRAATLAGPKPIPIAEYVTKNIYSYCTGRLEVGIYM